MKADRPAFPAPQLLLDTLVVRALVVPSVVALLGRWFFWPGNSPRCASTTTKVRVRQLVSAGLA
nr:MMPL family transporter [Mycobacterium sp. E787]